ncbi:MAG: sigma-54-dependent Fis family transcriptional regulator [Deltaproteobacteria bacterium]|nr:sigma-54-dependent Fis family transcriptional regulator [Deltaproteobacteria bacterium]
MPEATKACVLVAEDDPLVLGTVSRGLRRAGFEVRSFESGAEALAALEAGAAARTDVLLTDVQMPGGVDGLELLRIANDRWPDVGVIVMTAHATIGAAVEAMRRGAYDYLVKPFGSLDDLVTVVKHAVERSRLRERNRFLERQLEVSDRFDDMVGASPLMREVFALVESVAPVDSTVLVLGESGTGKELVARAIHRRSPRNGRAFVPINCAALTETLLESELFGHVRGAFSGATSNRRGVFEEASGGTLFLDEVGELSAATQVRLLRVLQEGEIRPVGSSEPRKVDPRVVAATNRDLPAAIRAGAFREDLYYRLNVVSIEVPALRRRPEDIAPLAHRFLQKHGKRLGKATARFEPEALELLIGYGWPGNVRELEHAMERALVLSKGDSVTPASLPPAVRDARVSAKGLASAGLPFAQAKEAAVAAFERGYVEELLSRSGGSLAEAARSAGLDRSNFRRLMKRHGIESR